MRAISSGAQIFIGTGLSDSLVNLQNLALAARLCDRGFRVSLLIHGPESDGLVIDPRVSVLRWPSPRPTGLADLRFVDRLIRRTRPCCLISHFGASTAMMSCGALRRVPIRIRWHHTLSSQLEFDHGAQSSLSRLLGRVRAQLMFSCVTHMVANSYAAKRDLVDNFDVPESRCSVFWNALADPLDPSADLGIKPSSKPIPPRFVCVGRFAPSKGQDVLIRSLPSATRVFPDLVVEFIGDGSTQETCERLASSLGVRDRCIFLGRLSRRQVLTHISGAAATIVPSRSEAFGLVNIESMSLGVPVIASNTGGIPEIVRPEVDGLLFETGNHEALGSCLMNIAGNGRLRTELGANSRQRFLDRFELSRAVSAQAEWVSDLVFALPRAALN